MIFWLVVVAYCVVRLEPSLQQAWAFSPVIARRRNTTTRIKITNSRKKNQNSNNNNGSVSSRGSIITIITAPIAPDDQKIVSTLQVGRESVSPPIIQRTEDSSSLLLDDVTTASTTRRKQQQQQQQQQQYHQQKKNTILFLLWAIAMVSSLDRVAMSVAMVDIAQEYGWSDSIKGAVSSWFSFGYGLGIVPTGLILANPVGTTVPGPKWVMAFGIVLWSLATMYTPLGVEATTETINDHTTTTANSSTGGGLLVLLCVLRMAVGLGESIVIPTVQRTLSVWTDASEKSRALALVFSGFATGTVLAYLLSPLLMIRMDQTLFFLGTGGSWRSLFHVYGGMGLLLVVPWWVLAQDSPATINVENNDLPKEQPEVPPPSYGVSLTNVPWQEFAKSPGVWGMLLAHAAKNWGLYNHLAWTPTFYAEQYGLTVSDSAWLSVVPSIAGAVGGGVAAVAADAWLLSRPDRSVEDVTRMRKLFQAIAFLGPAVALARLAYDIPEKASTAQWFLTITVGLQSFHTAGFEAGNQEKAGPKWSGLLYSVTSLPAVFVGTFAVWATGRILDGTDQDWSVVFAINSAVNVFGALAFLKLFNSKQEFD